MGKTSAKERLQERLKVRKKIAAALQEKNIPLADVEDGLRALGIEGAVTKQNLQQKIELYGQERHKLSIEVDKTLTENEKTVLKNLIGKYSIYNKKVSLLGNVLVFDGNNFFSKMSPNDKLKMYQLLSLVSILKKGNGAKLRYCKLVPSSQELCSMRSHYQNIWGKNYESQVPLMSNEKAIELTNAEIKKSYNQQKQNAKPIAYTAQRGSPKKKAPPQINPLTQDKKNPQRFKTPEEIKAEERHKYKRIKHLTQKNNATIIQKAYRNRHSIKQAAATQIQTAFRGKQARDNYTRLKQNPTRSYADVAKGVPKTQGEKRHLAGKKIAKSIGNLHRNSKLSERQDFLKQKAAATKISSIYRGNKAKEELANQKAAATQIQKVGRGYIEKEKYQGNKHIRNLLDKATRQSAKRNEAAEKIQRKYRNWDGVDKKGIIISPSKFLSNRFKEAVNEPNVVYL